MTCHYFWLQSYFRHAWNSNARLRLQECSLQTWHRIVPNQCCYVHQIDLHKAEVLCAMFCCATMISIYSDIESDQFFKPFQRDQVGNISLISWTIDHALQHSAMIYVLIIYPTSWITNKLPSTQWELPDCSLPLNVNQLLDNEQENSAAKKEKELQPIKF